MKSHGARGSDLAAHLLVRPSIRATLCLRCVSQLLTPAGGEVIDHQGFRRPFCPFESEQLRLYQYFSHDL